MAIDPTDDELEIEVQRILALSDEEVRAELIERGEDPDAVVTRIREMIRKIGSEISLRDVLAAGRGDLS